MNNPAGIEGIEDLVVFDISRYRHKVPEKGVDLPAVFFEHDQQRELDSALPRFFADHDIRDGRNRQRWLWLEPISSAQVELIAVRHANIKHINDRGIGKGIIPVKISIFRIGDPPFQIVLRQTFPAKREKRQQDTCFDQDSHESIKQHSFP